MGTQHQHHCHGHHHHHGHGHEHGNGGNILLAFCLNLGFSLVEFIGGLWTGSVSILSDALHDLGDALSLGLAWRLERLSQKGRDRHYSYGYKRFSLLSALFISTILIVGSIIMIKASIERIITPEMPNATGMLWLSIVGLAVNGFAAWRMSQGHSLSDRAIRLHLMEDVLGWAAVLVVSIVMLFVEWPILDPLLSLCIALWIIYNAYHTLRETLRILMQGVPAGLDLEGFDQEIQELTDVLGTHDLHAWTLNGEEVIASIHIIHHPDANTPDLKERVRNLAEQYNIHHLTIELDPQGSSCGMEHC